MNKPIISINLRPLNYAGLVNLANRVASSLAGNLNFATPAISVLALQAAVTDVINAIAVWGPKGNRGSHGTLIDLRSKALILAQLLKAEAQYVMTTATVASGTDFVAMQNIIISSGFRLANVKSPQGILQMAQGFQRFVSRQLDPNQVKLKWRKPLNVTSKSNVKSYRVLRGTTNVFSAATEIGTTTKTSFVDTNTTAASQTWSYWVVPVNTEGDGVISDVVTVRVPSI